MGNVIASSSCQVSPTHLSLGNSAMFLSPSPRCFESTLLLTCVCAAYVEQPDLGLYVVNALAVTQQMSAVALFLVVFMHMQDGLVSTHTVVSCHL